MLKTPLFAALAASVLVSGCATLQPEPRAVENTRTYQENRDVVWGRILSASTRNSMIVRQVDQANGLITVERDIVAPRGNTIYDWADCGWNGVFDRPVTQRVELNYLVRRGPEGVTVTVNGRYQELRLNLPMQKTDWVNCASTGVLERNLLDSFYYND